MAGNNQIVPVPRRAQLERFPAVGGPPLQGFLKRRHVGTVTSGGGNAPFETLNGRDQKTLALDVRPVERVFKPFQRPCRHTVAPSPKLGVDAAEFVHKGPAARTTKPMTVAVTCPCGLLGADSFAFGLGGGGTDKSGNRGVVPFGPLFVHAQ